MGVLKEILKIGTRTFLLLTCLNSGCFIAINETVKFPQRSHILIAD